MTKYTTNAQAREKAKTLIASRHYVIDSDWGDAQPSSSQENEYLESHGWDAYSEWFLAIDSDANEQTKERYHFPYGDFRRLHRSGLIAAKQRAAQNGHSEVESLADELLQAFDDQRN